MIRLFLAAFVLSLLQSLVPQQAKADTLEWTLRNEYSYIVYIRFFSQTYNNRVWPGGEDTYIYDDSSDHRVTLACERGEKICFGGFNANRDLFWGLGEFGKKRCTTCCRTCGEYYSDVDVLN
jgi:hypothetical protein